MDNFPLQKTTKKSRYQKSKPGLAGAKMNVPKGMCLDKKKSLTRALYFSRELDIQRQKTTGSCC
jgi:hypothetical protein